MDRAEYRQLYEAQAGHYGNDHLPKEATRVKFVLNSIKPGSKIFEVGCQTGGITRFLTEIGDVDAIDVSQGYVARARQNAPGARYSVGFAEDTVARSHYDAIVATEVLEHVLNPERLLARLYDALAPGGLLIVTVPDETYVDTLGEHLRSFTHESIEGLIKTQFEEISVKHVEMWYFAIGRKKGDKE